MRSTKVFKQYKRYMAKQAAREQEDWLRAEYNLQPRKPDWDERIVFWSAVSVFIVFLLLLVGIKP